MTIRILCATVLAVVISFAFLGPRIAKLSHHIHRDPQYGLEDIQIRDGAEFEIIAVPGLNAHKFYTWTRSRRTQNSESSTVEIHLLRDILGKSFDRANIRLFSYNSEYLIDAPLKTAKEIGDKLFMHLRESRRGKEHLPIVFLCHSFGGIIFKEGFCEPIDGTQGIIDNTSGIIFLGTPHYGSRIANIGAKVASLFGPVGSNTRLLMSLKQHDSSLFKLAKKFDGALKSKRTRAGETEIVSFHETKQTKLFGWLFLGLIVDEYSATIHADKSVTVDVDHSSLNKCQTEEDELCQELIREISRIKTPHILKEADKVIQEKCYNEETLQIERLSGDLLPMESAYINLVVSESGDKRNTYQSTGDQTAQVDLSNIFDKPLVRNGDNGNTPKRVLIRGPAGVGKTTLCKKIVYEFTYKNMWNDRFDRLLWIPLRRLKGRGPRYNLMDLFYDEYFSQNQKGNQLAKALWKRIGIPDDKTLFLVDGLDEVSGDFHTGDDMYQFFTLLLNQPNAIITSRPHVQLPTGVDVDLELDAIGFRQKQVDDYLNAVFPNDTERIKEVKQFIRRNQIMQSFVRIPISLDAICSTWDSFQDESSPQTMTTAYKMVVRDLCIKDIVRLEKEYKGKRIRSDDCKKMAPEKLNKLFESQGHLLEFFAFTGLWNETVEFTKEHQDEIDVYGELPDLDDLLGNILPKLSFLRSSDSSSRHGSRSYHFIHLTFQEYFAAQYFVRHWKGKLKLRPLKFGTRKPEEIDTRSFLRDFKYNRGYCIFWRFVTGLLHTEEKQIAEFFDEIEKTPRDLLGIVHQELIIDCLSEIPVNDETGFSKTAESLEVRLFKWIIFEDKIDRTIDNRLPRVPEIREHLLEKLLQDKVGDNRLTLSLIWNIHGSGRVLSPRVTNPIVGYLQKSSNFGVIAKSLSLLNAQPMLPIEALESISNVLDRDDLHSQSYGCALEILERQSRLPQDILTDKTLIRVKSFMLSSRCVHLKDHELCGKILRQQSFLPEIIHTELQEYLQAKNQPINKWDPVSRVAESLGKRVSLEGDLNDEQEDIDDQSSLSNTSSDEPEDDTNLLSMEPNDTEDLTNKKDQTEDFVAEGEDQARGDYSSETSSYYSFQCRWILEIPLLVLLKSSHNEEKRHGLHVARSWPWALSDHVLHAIVDLCMDSDLDRISFAFLNSQSSLPRSIIKRIVCLPTDRWVAYLESFFRGRDEMSIILDADIDETDMVRLCWNCLYSSLMYYPFQWHIYQDYFSFTIRDKVHRFSFGCDGRVQKQEFLEKIGRAFRKLGHPDWKEYGELKSMAAQYGV